MIRTAADCQVFATDHKYSVTLGTIYDVHSRLLLQKEIKKVIGKPSKKNLTFVPLGGEGSKKIGLCYTFQKHGLKWLNIAL